MTDDDFREVNKIIKTGNQSLKVMSFTFDKYPFLKELGLSESNHGCWDGEKWTGDGKVFHSINPSTNEIIAEVKGASAENYETATKNMLAAKSEWMKVMKD